MNELLNRKITDLSDKLEHLRGYLDLPHKIERIKAIDQLMAAGDFWSDQDEANKVIREAKSLKSVVDPFSFASKQAQDAKELLEMAEGDVQMEAQIEAELIQLTACVDKLEIQAFLSGPYDNNNAIVSLNSGAGGTESCDWTSMLFRMYTRWAESKGYKVEVFDILEGEEAGIKNVSFRIEGEKAYGYLKCEKGVHRLVRISPFDSNKRRHTSFASFDAIPEIEDDVEVEISPDDLKVDVFRSSGPGGQSVNTCDSAVRITHMPTGIIVSSQVERSQLQNRVRCMKVLKAKLFERQQAAMDAKIAAESGLKQKIEWGSQIRSYVLQPYQMIKDHRTDFEVGAVQKVLDGDIDGFIEAFLKMKPEGKG